MDWERKFIDYLDAFVADGAVGTPRGPVELAGDAPLHPDCHSVDVHILVERRPKVVVFVLIRRG